MKNLILLVAIAAFSLLTGCASIVNGTTQDVSVTTPPASGAKCVLKNDRGEWYVNKTPGSTVVRRAYGPLSVDCKKAGFKETKKTVISHTKGMAFGNVIFGGVIGAGVDVATGSAYDYPQTIVVPMKKMA